ncbi:YqaA family protein [Tuberibacillus sp. Marseille-P3662]|uniref:YqaA family protein n=1 Tax=Tuberibacillus sp. Marseille-P3662 TaxID=1965358 RepID=UPI000A1CCB95|nr:YqaA family protein [Tuberibacillus sp. Marseille-P3662]
MHQWIEAMADFFLKFDIWGLMIVAFTESSFFLVPPDVLLIPLALANPSSALLYALVTTVSSVAGALLGWWIGRLFGRKILAKFVSDDKIDLTEGYFKKYGGASLAIAGFTPVPYKIFTIISGIFRVAIPQVIIWSLIGRGVRFFAEGLLITFYGEEAKRLINDYLGTVSLAVVIVGVIGYTIYRLIKRNRFNP